MQAATNKERANGEGADPLGRGLQVDGPSPPILLYNGQTLLLPSCNLLQLLHLPGLSQRLVGTSTLEVAGDGQGRPHGRPAVAVPVQEGGQRHAATPPQLYGLLEGRTKVVSKAALMKEGRTGTTAVALSENPEEGSVTVGAGEAGETGEERLVTRVHVL